MTRWPIFIILHLVALLLACTAFTLITAPLGRSDLSWTFFSYGYSNGWGYEYHSEYSLAQVLAYLVAYAAGAVLYAFLKSPPLVTRLAMIVCLVGTASFIIELSHWFIDHHLSLIASAPALLLISGVWTLISQMSAWRFQSASVSEPQTDNGHLTETYR